MQKPCNTPLVFVGASNARPYIPQKQFLLAL